MTTRSVLEENRQVQLAIALIELGARLQFLESEVDLSRERLVRLYKEIRGVSPPKGLLPYSVDWYMTWKANIHSTMFVNIHRFVRENTAPDEGRDLQHLVKAYTLYLEQVQAHGDKVELEFTRAYMLVKYFAADLLHLSRCSRCTGEFVTHAYDSTPDYVCVLCRPPSRAGKPLRGKGFTDLVKHASASAGKTQGPAAPGPSLH
jgi:flagellar transcriptional activator FlhC